MKFQTFKLVLEKTEEPEIKLPTSAGSWKKQGVPEKYLFLLYWLCQSLWLSGSQRTVENSSKDGNNSPPDLPPEKSVCRSRSNRTRHGTKEWFQIGKGVHKHFILTSCLFNLYSEYIIWNPRLDEAQAGIKIAQRNISNLTYADDTTLMEESKVEVKILLMKVKEWKGWFKTQNSKN